MLGSLRCCLFQEKKFWEALLRVAGCKRERHLKEDLEPKRPLIFRELWGRVTMSFLNIQSHFQFCTGGQWAHRRPLPMCRSKLPPPLCLVWRACFHSSLQLITPPVAVKSAFEDALAAGLYHLIVQSIVPGSNV